MQRFSYEALTMGGTIDRGEMVALSETELEARLRQQDQYLIRAELLDGSTPLPNAPRRTDGSVGRKDLLGFTEYLWGSLQAGIPILATLEDVEAQLESKRLRKITVELRDAISEGKSLSEAMAEHPNAFPKLYVGTIEAGESTGQLEHTLKQLVDHLEWQREIALQIRQATLYPTIVLTAMAGLLVMLVVFVYPRLLPVFAGFEAELPLPTRMVMAAADLLRAYWYALIAGGLGLLLLWGVLHRSERGRLALDTIKLRLPIFGALIHQIEMSRLVTYMALFYRTGIDLVRGLEMLERMMTNRRIGRAVQRAREAIVGGDSITHAFGQTQLFPPVVIRGIALGEATGKLDETLERARLHYAREVPAAVRRMLGALQPLLIIVLGAVLALVALSIVLPIMNIYRSIGR